MKKCPNLILILTLIFFSSLNLHAEEVKVQPIEGELRCGATLPLGGFHDGSPKIGPMIGLELRYNLKKSPFDIGLMVDFTTAMYGFKRQNLQSNRTAFIALASDYNFGQGKKINPFAGIGIGWGTNDELGDVVYYGNKDCSAVFIPRIGVEIIRHIRFTLSTNLSTKGYNNLSLTLGIVIGGRPKK